MQKTFYWHDYETWGANPAVDRPINIKAREPAIESLVKNLQNRADVARVEYFTPEQVLAD